MYDVDALSADSNVGESGHESFPGREKSSGSDGFVGEDEESDCHQSLIVGAKPRLDSGLAPKPSKTRWNRIPVAAAVMKNANVRALLPEEGALVVIGTGIGDEASRGNS
jgi:hypothetical protein